LGFSLLLGPREAVGEAGVAICRAKAIESREMPGWTQEADIRSAVKTLFGR